VETNAEMASGGMALAAPVVVCTALTVEVGSAAACLAVGIVAARVAYVAAAEGVAEQVVMEDKVA